LNVNDQENSRIAFRSFVIANLREKSDHFEIRLTMQQANPTAISVLIRTFNSKKTLGQVLSKIELAEGDEYIIVDSGSTDSTLSIAAAHGARIIHARGPFNYSKSLNLGFQAAQNPWVLVISSHSIPVVPNFLDLFRSAARDFPTDVVVGYGPNTFDGRKAYGDDNVRYYTGEGYKKIDFLCGNGNALYRRSAWEDVPFDETIRTAEDRAWLAEIFKRGLNIALVPGPRTINASRYSLSYMFRKGYSDSRSAPHKAQSLLDLAMGVCSLAKRFVTGRMPFGNFIRRSALCVGAYFGSQQSQDNTPGK
jgi:glycosyltransferase involved in cell wall biosynthesis